MAIASITAWLNSTDKPYPVGRALYEQYGEDRVTLILLKSGSGSYHRTKLIAALEGLNQNSNLVPKAIVIDDIAAAAPQAPDRSAPEYAKAPDKILEIRDQKNLQYAQARKLFEMISILDSRELRLQAGLQLLDLMDTVNDCWAVIDEWKEHGRIREIQENETTIGVDQLTNEQLYRECKNIPTYITKDKKKLKAATTPRQKAKIATRLQLRELRLSLVKKRLENEFIQV